MSYVKRGIRLAHEAAMESDCPDFRVGAALLKSNRIVSIGRNWFKRSHTQSQTRWNGIHAEFDCLNKIGLEKAKNCTIFVVRITKGGNLAMARPCEHCLNLINKYKIKVVYYTGVQGQVVREKV